MFGHPIDQQYLPATLLKLVDEVNRAVAEKIKVTHINEQTGAVGAEFLFSVLQEEGGFSYAACPLDTNQTVTPADLVRKIAANEGIGVLNEVGMRTVEWFYLVSLSFG